MIQEESEVVQRILLRLHQTSDEVQKLWNRELAQIGISRLDAAALSWLDRSNRPVSPVELSRWMRRDLEPTTALLRRMRAKGLVTINRESDQRDTMRIAIMPRGQRAYEDSLRHEVGCGAVSRLSESERQQLDALLEKLVHGLLDDPEVR